MGLRGNGGRSVCIGLMLVIGLANSATAKPKPSRLEWLRQATVAKSSLPKAAWRTLSRLHDGQVTTSIEIRQPIDLVYAIGKTISPEQLSLQLHGVKGKSRAAARIEIMASSLSADAGFQLLRSDIVKLVQRRQKYRFVAVGCKWLFVRITPLPSAAAFRIGEMELHGREGKPTTRYKFKESPAKSIQVLMQLRNSLGVEVSPVENNLFEDAGDGKLDKFSFAEASLVASGVTSRRQRKSYLRQIDDLEKKFRKTIAGELPVDKKARALLLWLHQGAFKGGYRYHQTRVSTVLENRTYNCVSSAAVYNVLGRRLGLDLRGIEVPTHAFSILYDSGRHFDVETTSRHGFAPKRNSAVLKELRDKNGLHYIPDRYRHLRREINDLGIVALIYYNRGVGLSRKKQYAAALVAYFGALSLDREFASAVKGVLGVLTNWSLHLARSRDYEQSLRVVKVGLQLAPEDARLRNNHIALWQQWARQEMDGQRFDRALAIVRRAQKHIKQGPFKDMESWVFTRPGEAQISRGNWQTALKIARTGLKRLDGKAKKDLQKWRNGIYLRWGNREMKRQRYKQALAAFSQGLRVSSDRRISNNMGYLTSVWAKKKLKTETLENALQLLDRLKQQFPKVKDIHKSADRFAYQVVSSTVHKKQYEDGLAKLEQVKPFLLDGKTERKLGRLVYDRWARSYWQKDGQHDKALDIYRRALKQFPGERLLIQNACFVWNRKGMAQIKTQNWGEAIAVYQSGLKEFPKCRTLQKNLQYCQKKLAK